MIRRNWANILTGALIGLLLAASLAYVSARWNDAVVFGDVRAVVELSTRGHERWLAVQYQVIRAHACPSWSQHLIFRDNQMDGHTQRNYVPLAITSNGVGASPDARDFAISFRLPPDLLPGTWYYTVVTSASCEWLPGLQRETVSETAPVAVRIP